jgi:hypothetical protein
MTKTQVEVITLLLRPRPAPPTLHRRRTEGPSGACKTTMIVALARKLLIALWRLVTTGEVPDGVELWPGGVSNTVTRKEKQGSAPDCA